MAQRNKISRRGSIQDRRGQKAIGRMGTIGLGGVVILLAVGLLGSPEDALELLGSIQQTQVQTQTTDQGSIYEGDDEYEVFVSQVLGSNDALWSDAFAQSDLSYREPTLVLFRDLTESACGGAVAQAGPHYCPLDETIYLDETFFQELTQRFGAQGGDMAQAYVIAHEVGHHVQHQLGLTDRVQAARSRGQQAANQASIQLELQADCLAGIRASSVEDILDRGDIDEAIDAASAVGDDSIQQQTSGRVHPESWTHGSSAQRKERFTRGYDTGDFDQCDTFGA